jgi:hypothetical protein
MKTKTGTTDFTDYTDPMAWGTYMLRKPFVLVFIRLRVKARAASWEAAVKINREDTRKDAKKIQKNLCNLWASFFHRLRVLLARIMSDCLLFLPDGKNHSRGGKIVPGTGDVVLGAERSFPGPEMSFLARKNRSRRGRSHSRRGKIIPGTGDVVLGAEKSFLAREKPFLHTTFPPSQLLSFPSSLFSRLFAYLRG